MRPAIEWCDVPVIGDVGCNPIWDGPESWFESAITSAAGAIYGFAMSMLSWIWDLINDITRPQTDAPFIYEWASRVFAISLPIIVAFLVIQVSMIVLRTRSSEGLGKAVAMAGVAVLGTAASVPIVHLLTSAVDSLADDLTVLVFDDLDNLGTQFTDAVGLGADLSAEQMAAVGAGSVVAGAFGFVVFGVFLVLGAIGVFGALLIRTMLLYVTMVMGPLAIMGLAWEKSRSWFKIWVGVTVTLIVSKLAIMIVFGLGVTVLETLSFGEGGAGIAGAMLTGTLMLLMAALMPIACFKFINFVGDEAQASGLHGDTQAGAQRAGDAAKRAGPSQIMRSMRSKDDDSGKGSPRSSGKDGPGNRSKPDSGQGKPDSGQGKPDSGQGKPSTGSSPNGQGPSGQGKGAPSGSSSGAPTAGKVPSGLGSSTSPASGAAGSGAAGSGAAGASGGSGAAGAGGAAAGAVGAAVGATVKAGRQAAQTAADQTDSTTGQGRTGPDMTRPNE